MKKNLSNSALDLGARSSFPYGNEVVIPEDENPYSTIVGRTDLNLDGLSVFGLRQLLIAQVRHLLGEHDMGYLTPAIVLKDGVLVGVSFTNSHHTPLTLQQINKLKRDIFPDEEYPNIQPIGCKAFWPIN